MKIFYLPMESYVGRAYSQLHDWTINRFKEAGLEVVDVQGSTDLIESQIQINTGLVIDAHGRAFWGMTQLAELVKMMRNGEVTADDVIYNQDIFHPGWESLPYILQQLKPEMRPRIYTHVMAQSIDPDDFTFPMRDWMRHYELLVDKTATGILLASTVMVEMMRTAMFEAPMHVVGLPTDKNEIRERALKGLGEIPEWNKRSNRIVFTSRWDREKQPWFFMDMIERIQNDERFRGWEFAICSGSKELRSNEQQFVDRARRMEVEGKLSIYDNLSKDSYYAILADSKIQFNCARQDFVSNTLLESSALGTVTLAPAYRSFPETLFNNERQMFIPWSVTDAIEKLYQIMIDPPLEDVGKPADYHHLCLDRVIDLFKHDTQTQRIGDKNI